MMEDERIEDIFRLFLAGNPDKKNGAEAFAIWLERQGFEIKKKVNGAPKQGDLVHLRSPKLPPDYSDRGQIGLGAIGEVRRVFDTRLKRTVALKVMRSHLIGDEEALERFMAEAQITAQLQHPGIVPVHDLAQFSHGHPYFTMKEVEGRTLSEVIQEVHGCVKEGNWHKTPSGWTFQRLISVFRRVCETMAYAHARGVIHRDIKPSNIMVGEFGEVLVLDWGVAKVLGRPGEADQAANPLPVITARSTRSGQDTHLDVITGTPAYMAPEQAEGKSERLGPHSDVYALGAVLYEILSGRPPYQCPAAAVLGRLMSGAPEPVGRVDGQSRGQLLPDELKTLCEWAMSREPTHRPGDARVLAVEVGAWLEGVRRRSQALEVVEKARALEPEIARMKDEARALRVEARAMLDALPPHADVAQKQVGWQGEDRAAGFERNGDLMELHYLQLLRSALNLQPDLFEAHGALATYYHRRHREAESRGNGHEAEQLDMMLRAHDVEGRYEDYLKGEGELSLEVADGVQIEVHQLMEIGRRLVPQSLGPLEGLRDGPIRLPHGRYLLRFAAPGHHGLDYPVVITRSSCHERIRPGMDKPQPITLLPEGTLGPNEALIPAGYFRSGGDALAAYALPRRDVWLDDFIMAKYPVTNQEYLAFLNDLVAQDRADDALKWVPRERSSTLGVPGAMIYGRNIIGRFYLREDGDGEFWHADEPVTMVDWASANAYATWLAESTGLPWRLPFELEREKAARGVDGRAFPFGDFLDPTWVCIKSSHRGHPNIRPIHEFESDESIYGVRGLAGNVMDWCLDLYHEAGPRLLAAGLFEPQEENHEAEDPQTEARVCRGGYWAGSERLSRSCSRFGYDPSIRGSSLGFRVVRSLKRED